MDQRYIGTLSSNSVGICDGRIEWIPTPGKPGHQSGIILQLDRPLSSAEVEKINSGQLVLSYNKQTVTHVAFLPDVMDLDHDARVGDSVVVVTFRGSFDPDAPPTNQ